MSYATAQVSADANAAQTLRTAVEALLTGHSAWSFVKEYTYSSFTARTWKCLGTENGLGADFYVTLAWQTVQTADGATYWQVHEDFAEPDFIRPAQSPGSTFTPDATYAAGANRTPGVTEVRTDVSTADFTYWLVVTKRGIFIRSSASFYAQYVGLFEPLFGHAQEFPLWQWEIGDADNDSAGSVTRRPSCSGISMSDAFAIYSALAALAEYPTPIGDLPLGSGLSEGVCFGGRYLLNHTTITNGRERGFAYDCLVFLNTSGVGAGDEITVEGETYVCFYAQTDRSLWVHKAAA